MAEVFNGARRIVAKMAADSGAMDQTAEEVASVMRTVADREGAGGEFINSIGVVRAGRGLDRIVGASDWLSVPIEMGHVIRNEPDGPVLGYVRGKHVVPKTVANLPEVTGD
jgi:hypothetical protein